MISKFDPIIYRLITPGKKSGFVLATTLTPASEHDSNYLPYFTIASCHTNNPIETVYGDKGYLARWNRDRAFATLQHDREYMKSHLNMHRTYSTGWEASQSSLSPYEWNQRRNNAERYHHRQTYWVRDKKEQEDIQEKIHSWTILWIESFTWWSI